MLNESGSYTQQQRGRPWLRSLKDTMTHALLKYRAQLITAILAKLLAEKLHYVGSQCSTDCLGSWNTKMLIYFQEHQL